MLKVGDLVRCPLAGTAGIGVIISKALSGADRYWRVLLHGDVILVLAEDLELVSA